MFSLGDKLLFALSSQTQLSWDRCKRLFGSLYCDAHYGLAEISGKPIRLIRSQAFSFLDALGHCDILFQDGYGRVRIASPVVAMLPTAGLPRAVVCGARAPGTFDQLELTARTFAGDVDLQVEFREAETSLVSARIELQTESLAVASEFCQKAGLRFYEYPPSWSLAELSGSISEFLERLVWQDVPELNWNRWEYDVHRLMFLPIESSASNQNQLTLRRYLNPTFGNYDFRLWKRGKSALVDLNWGRLAVLIERHPLPISYDPLVGTLTCPARLQLPRLLRRSLVLSSGRVPSVIEAVHGTGSTSHQGPYEVFKNIGGSLLSVFASKIGVSPKDFLAKPE